MRRALTLMFLLMACGGTAATTTVAPTTTTTTTAATTTTTAPTTTTLSDKQIAQAELETDTDLIADLYRAYSDSWFQGLEAGYQFLAAHNHPSMGCTVDDYRTYYDWTEGSTDETIVHQDTIQRHDGWILPDTGDVPEGRIYVYQITETAEEPGFLAEEKLLEVHASILDGEAFFFIACRALE